jgi:hypothetical protein
VGTAYAYTGHGRAYDAVQINQFGTPPLEIIKELESVPNGGYLRWLRGGDRVSSSHAGA